MLPHDTAIHKTETRFVRLCPVILKGAERNRSCVRHHHESPRRWMKYDISSCASEDWEEVARPLS